MDEQLTYKSAGVDIDAAEEFIRMIRQRIARAWPKAAKEIGGFAGGGPIPKGITKLDGATDGPGTKIILAALVEIFSGIGQDVVAMSAVDDYVAGSRPAYLWDSLKVACLKPELHIQIIDSIIEACKLAGCRLVGGETAEMPDLYRFDWMCDVDTFVVGFPDTQLQFVPVRSRQEIWGWPSYGLCANGTSLVRKVFGLKAKPSVVRKRLERIWPEFGILTLAEEILKPTPIWIEEIEKKRKKGIKFSGHAHITGGGMVDNIPRMLPPNFKAVIYRDSWQRPAIFPLIQAKGNVPDDVMDRTFNQGVIVASVVDNVNGKQMSHRQACQIGEIKLRQGNEPQVEFVGAYNDG